MDKRYSSAYYVFGFTCRSCTSPSLGSVTLSSVLSEIANEYLSEIDHVSNCSEYEIAIKEWRAFLLAAACASCDSTADDFLGLFNSGLITEPGFLLFGRFLAEDVSEKTWLNTDTIEAAKKLYKKLDKKWKNNSLYRKYLREVEIVPLPPPDE